MPEDGDQSIPVEARLETMSIKLCHLRRMQLYSFSEMRAPPHICGLGISPPAELLASYFVFPILCDLHLARKLTLAALPGLQAGGGDLPFSGKRYGSR